MESSDEGIINNDILIGAKCCCGLPQLRSRVSIMAIMDIIISVILVVGGAYHTLHSTVIQDYNLLFILCSVTGLCILADLMLLYLPNESGASALWIFTHGLIYISWIFVVFGKVENADWSKFDFGLVMRLILQPFIELISLLSVYGWFTWILAVNWVNLNEFQPGYPGTTRARRQETPPPDYDVVMGVEDVTTAAGSMNNKGAGTGDNKNVALEEVVCILSVPGTSSRPMRCYR